MFTHILIITLFAILGFFLAKIFILVIEKFPNYLYQAWISSSQEILNLKNLQNLDTIDTTIRHKKLFILTTIAMFVISAFMAPTLFHLLAYITFISIILILIIIDYKTMLLPDELTLTLIGLGLLFNLNGLIAGNLQNSVYGAIIGYLILWSIFWIFKLLMKKDGMGYGDFKLLSAILAFLGIQYLVPMLLLSSILGLLYVVIMTIYNKLHSHKIDFKDDGAIPFGPYLGLAGIILLLWGNSINFIHMFVII